MFISNIISKLPAIIYKPRIIYKATTAPTNMDQHPRSTNINTGSIEPLYTTCSHTQHTTTSMCLFFSLFRSYELHYNIYLLYSPYTYSYLSVGVFVLQVSPPVKDTSLSRRVKFGTPFSHVHADVPRFQILVKIFGAHRGVAVKHTPQPLVNPLTFIHG